MTENTTQAAECLSRLTAELEALRIGNDMTNTEREKLKWAYIVEQNELLRLENVGLKLWIGTLLNSDGFDNGRYDAHDLRIARNQIKKMLDGQLIQEEIGVEFSRVLFDNLWDLYIDV